LQPWHSKTQGESWRQDFSLISMFPNYCWFDFSSYSCYSCWFYCSVFNCLSLFWSILS